MNYDFSLSENVSLSRILDQLINSIIQKLLEYNRLDILKDWIEYDEAGFNEAYNISDLVKYMLKLKYIKAA